MATDGPSVIFEREVWASDLVRLAGFEPATRCLEGSRSVQLSYRRRPPIVQAQSHVADTSALRGGDHRLRKLVRSQPRGGHTLNPYQPRTYTGCVAGARRPT